MVSGEIANAMEGNNPLHEKHIGHNLYGRELALSVWWRTHMRKQLILALGWMLCGTFESLSTTVEKFTLDELVQKSGRIIVGKCISRESRWNDRNTLILTTTRFA